MKKGIEIRICKETKEVWILSAYPLPASEENRIEDALIEKYESLYDYEFIFRMR